MRSDKNLAFGAFANAAAFIVTLGVTFWLAPIVLRSLGDDRYGAWSFVESFVAYLTLFDFGLAAAMVRFVPRSLTRGDDSQLDRVYSAALVVFLAGAAIALAIGLSFDLWCLDRFLKSPELRSEFHGLFRMLVLNFVLTLPLSIYPAMLDGLQQFAFKSGVRTFVLLARVPLTLWAIQTEQRLLALGIVITACNLLEHLIFAVAVRWHLPALRFRPLSVDRGTLGEVTRYSRDAFLAMLAGRLSFHTDAFVIGPLLGLPLVTLFSFPAKLVEMSKSILRQGTSTLTSRFSALDAADDRPAMQRLFLIGTLAAWCCALPLQVGLYLFGKPFLALWVGPAYAEAGAPVLFILAATLPLTIAQSVSSRVLYANGQLGWFAKATLTEGVLNLILSLILVKPLGISGVALGTALPHAAFCVYVIHRVRQTVGVPVNDYLRVVALAAIAVVPPTVVWWYLSRPGLHSWPDLFGVGLAGGAVYIAVVAVTVLGGKWLRSRPARWAVGSPAESV